MSSKQDRAQLELDMMAVRLRSSNTEREERLYDHGHSAGDTWAKKWATPDEFQKLDVVRKANEGIFGFGIGDDEATLACAKFVFTIRPSESANGNAPHQFWLEYGLNGGLPNRTFVCAFAEGAMEAWDAVQRKLAPPEKRGATDSD